MKFLYKIFLLLLLIPLSNSYAQLDLSHEVGVSFGPVAMQTDYGERNHLPSSMATSFGVSVSHYLSFYGSNYNWRNGASFFSDHFKLRTEISIYTNTNLEHKGVPSEIIGPFGDQIRAMKGSTKVFNVGTQLEYYFKNLEDYGLLFNDDNKFAPYVSAGFHYNSFDPELTNDNGNLNIATLPEPWQENAVFLEKDTTFSLSFSAGTRYKMNNFDVFIDARWQYFLSDKIDGLDAPSDLSGSKFNDTLIYLSVGAIFDLSNLSR